MDRKSDKDSGDSPNQDTQEMDEVLRRMLNTPPKPHKEKGAGKKPNMMTISWSYGRVKWRPIAVSAEIGAPRFRLLREFRAKLSSRLAPSMNRNDHHSS